MTFYMLVFYLMGMIAMMVSVFFGTKALKHIDPKVAKKSGVSFLALFKPGMFTDEGKSYRQKWFLSAGFAFLCLVAAEVAAGKLG